MNLRTIIAGVALASLLTGCGGSGDRHAGTTSSPGVGSGASNDANTAALWRQLAQCVRRHGAPNFPDPVQQHDGTWGLPPNTGKPPLSAMNACKSIADRIPRKPPPPPADMAKLRQFAQCMREHGLPDWPDPDSRGAFRLPPRLQQGGKGRFGSQMKACERYNPNGGIRIVESG